MSPLAATGGGGGLAEALARIASSLRIPVLVLALLVLLVCAVEVGRFATELYSRARAGRGALRDLARQVVANPGQAAALSARAPSAFAREALLEIARAILAGEQDGIEHALADYELAVQRRLDHTRILVRAGPALGLMGTLIPLAPGLAALGHGEVATLATDLRTAFAATTIGLLVGTVAFALTLTRTRMYSEDLTALERAVAIRAAMRRPLTLSAPCVAASACCPDRAGTASTCAPRASPRNDTAGAATTTDPAGPAESRPMTRRTGLGRHGRIEDAAGDPLDGLVNLFDIGIVLAVAFLIAGLGPDARPAHPPAASAHADHPGPADPDAARAVLQRARGERAGAAGRHGLPAQRRAARLRAGKR